MLAIVRYARLVCSLEAGGAGAADGGAAAVVLVVRGCVVDAGVQPDGVVVDLDAAQLGVERGGVADVAAVAPGSLET